jgi:hypothetical protein
MTPLEGALRRIAADLTDAADVAVAVPGDPEAEALVRQLTARGYRIDALVEQDAIGRLATVRLTGSRQPGAPVVDLLFASSGIEAEVVADADVIELLPGLRMAVATVGHLIALKVLSRDDRRRPQDLLDLRALLAVASPGEIARAGRALDLITARSFHRGRALRAELDALTRPD